MKSYLFLIIISLSFNSASLFACGLRIVSMEYEAKQTRYQMFSGSITIENTRPAAVRNYSVINLYLSHDSVFDKSDKPFALASFLDPEKNEPQTFTFSGTSVKSGINPPPGDYYLIAVAGTPDEKTESGAKNHHLAKPFKILPALVDYTFSSITKDKETVAKGDVITINYGLLNLGTENVKALNIKFYLSGDSVFEETDILWMDNDLEVNWQKSVVRSVRLAVPHLTREPDYYIFAKIGGTAQQITIEDTDMDNNVAGPGAVKITESERDLGITEIIPYATGFSFLKISYQVNNTCMNGLQGFGVKFYLSKDQVLTDEDLLFSGNEAHNHPSQYLGPDQRIELRHTFSAHETRQYLPSGTWHIIALLNEDKRIAETDYTNNLAVSAPFTIEDYNVSVNVQSAVLSPPLYESANEAGIDVAFLQENFSGTFPFSVEIYNETGFLLKRDLNVELQNSPAETFHHLSLDAETPFSEGKYTLKISSPFETESFITEFTVAPVFSGLSVETTNDSLLFTWESPLPQGLSAYTLELFSKGEKIAAFESTKNNLNIKRQNIIAQDYTWRVTTVFNGTTSCSAFAALALLPLAVEIRDIAFCQETMERDDSLHFDFTLINRQYRGDLELTFTLVNSQGKNIDSTQELFTLHEDAGRPHRKSWKLAKPLVRGNYTLVVNPVYSPAVTKEFFVSSPFSEQRTTTETGPDSSGKNFPENTAAKVKVFPNPFSDIINLNYLNDDISFVELHTLQGLIIKSFSVSAGQEKSELKVENLQEGLYLFSFFDRHRNKIGTAKVIKF